MPAATVSKMAQRLGGRQAAGRDPLAEVPTSHQAAHDDGAVGFSPVVEQRYDVGVLDPRDALQRRLEPSHELGMAHHPRAEDPQRNLTSDRGLIGAMDLTKLADSDDRAQLVAGDGALHRARERRRQPVDEELGEVRAEPVAHELVDVQSRVESDDVVAAERLPPPSLIQARR